MAPKRKYVESEMDNTQGDPNQPDAPRVIRPPRPKRMGAGTGGAAKQLENCANAITRVHPKRLCVAVPSSEPVNKMAPAPSPKKGRRHAKAQRTGKKSTNERGTASSTMPVDPVTTPVKFSTKPTFHLGEGSSRFGFRGLPGGHSENNHASPPRDPPPMNHQPEQYEEIMPVDDEYLLQDWKNALELDGIDLSAYDETPEEVPAIHSEPEDHRSNANDHSSSDETDAGSVRTGRDDSSDGSDQGDGGDSEAENDQHSAFGRGTRMDNDDDIEVDGPLAEEDTGARHEESGTKNRPRGGRSRHRQPERRPTEGACTQSEISMVKERPRSHKHGERGQHSRELGEEIEGEHDVLGRHHQRNRIPRPPSQNDLEHRRRFAETSEADHTDIEVRQPRNKSAEKRSFWPRAWQNLIDDAKVEWRVYLAACDTFPSHSSATQELIPDIICQCLSKYKRARIRLESGMIPRYQEELYTIVYQDSSNFRSEIKKLCVRNVVSLYDLEPPSKLREEESIRWVRDRASQLIRGAKFLRGARDAQGRERNFAHKSLYTISAAAYYGTSQKLLGRTPEFKEYLPEAAIVLVAAGIKSVLCSLERRGKIHDLGTQVEPINRKVYEKLHEMIGQVVNHQVSGPHLQQQLERWAKLAR
ncbi:hypothetical protein EDD15DRAFT_2374909 [Pisolithus albus]|nr:hypothetical protein EDD15DRAFT_2374909 [Pisolithus albus]